MGSLARVAGLVILCRSRQPASDAGAEVVDVVGADVPQRALLDRAADAIGEVFRLLVPPRRHFQIIGWGCGNEIETVILRLAPVQHRPAVNARVIAAGLGVEEDNRVSGLGVLLGAALGAVAPVPALPLPDFIPEGFRRPFLWV